MSFLNKLQELSTVAEELRNSKQKIEEEKRGKKVFESFKRNAEAAAKDGQRMCVAMKLSAKTDYKQGVQISSDTEVVDNGTLNTAAETLVALLRKEGLVPRYLWMTDHDADDRGLGGAPGDYHIVVHW